MVQEIEEFSAELKFLALAHAEILDGRNFQLCLKEVGKPTNSETPSPRCFPVSPVVKVFDLLGSVDLVDHDGLRALSFENLAAGRDLFTGKRKKLVILST